MSRNKYGKTVTPDSNLERACPRCGHVTRAFDRNCPQCGKKLSGGIGFWGWLGIIILVFFVLVFLFSLG